MLLLEHKIVLIIFLGELYKDQQLIVYRLLVSSKFQLGARIRFHSINVSFIIIFLLSILILLVFFSKTSKTSIHNKKRKINEHTSSIFLFFSDNNDSTITMIPSFFFLRRPAAVDQWHFNVIQSFSGNNHWFSNFPCLCRLVPSLRRVK